MTGRNDNTDDTLLSAYLDGELPRTEADALTERLAREPALMARLEALRASDERARAMFAAVDRQPMPQRVLELLDAASETAPADNVLQFPPRGVRQFLQVPVAIAASVALIAGFLANGFLNRAIGTDDTELLSAGVVAADSELFDVLETGDSEQTYLLADGATAEIVLTFEDVNGDYCRQTRITAAGRATHGLACRRDDAWRLEALSFGPATAPGGEFQLASGSTPPALDAAIDALIGSGDALDSQEEKAIISNTWKKPAE